LVIGGQGVLNLTSGTMTLRGGEVTVEPNASLRARGTVSAPAGKIIAVADTIIINGSIDASGAPGGMVTLTSTGTLTVGGVLDVRSRSNDDNGGDAELQGIDITITASGRVTALGGAQGFGGTIGVNAGGALVVGGALTASGGEGGEIDISAAGALTVNASIIVEADGTAAGGSGGDVTVSAIGVLTMNGVLSAVGRNGSTDTGGGDGGNITIDGSTVNVTLTAARVAATAGGPDGLGGDVEVTSSNGGIDFRGHLDAAGPGTEGTGGTVSIDAAGPAIVSGEINVKGGGDSGGDLDVSSGTDLTIGSSASFSVEAMGVGIGGDIDLSGGGSVTIDGALSSDGGAAQGGGGGTITASGCIVRVGASGRLSSQRDGGINTLVGRDITIVAGVMRADASSGQNVIRFAGPDYSPSILPGSQIIPAASLVEDSTIVPCNPVNTPTPTIGPGDTPTPTATVLPSACVGDCDGNGVVTVSDLITGVNIALGNLPLANCPAFDPDGSGMVTVGELIQGVNNALNGCPG
jgi:hypothetical protein